jgi:hypothetical protein
LKNEKNNLHRSEGIIMKREQIYLEGDEKVIMEILEIARNNLGKGINVVNLMPCIEKWMVIQDLRDILDTGFPEDDLKNYIEKLEEQE